MSSVRCTVTSTRRSLMLMTDCGKSYSLTVLVGNYKWLGIGKSVSSQFAMNGISIRYTDATSFLTTSSSHITHKTLTHSGLTFITFLSFYLRMKNQTLCFTCGIPMERQKLVELSYLEKETELTN